MTEKMNVTQGLPELHLHLDGSLREITLRELAAREGVELPGRLSFSPGMGLSEALALFSHTLSVLQSTENLRRVADEICLDARADGVSTLEIRFAPHLHTVLGLRVEDVVDAVLEGIDDRAGLILCGLYEDDPARLMQCVEVARTRPGVVGIDLAGGPTSDRMTDPFEVHRQAFLRARSLGIGRTVHAAEGRPPEETIRAVTGLHADRIGHGTTLLTDPKAAQVVLEHDVTIEACITSNWHVGAIGKPEDHPFARWYDRGVRFAFSADNSLFSRTTTAGEYRLAAEILGEESSAQSILDWAKQCGHAARFIR